MWRPIAIVSLLTISASAPVIDFAKRIHFRTGDAVVIGTLKNLDYQSVDGPDDLLGHGFITAKLHVIRVDQGRVPSSDLEVKYFGHTYLMENREFRFHIRPSKDGIYSICFDRGEGIRCK